MINKIDFDEFLKRKGAYKRFYKKFLSSNSKREFITYFTRVIPNEYILKAFYWKKDKHSRAEFWIDLDRKWRKELKKVQL